MKSEIKHISLFMVIISVILLLAFTLESSELNNITKISISGNRFLDSDQYLEFSQLNNLEEQIDLSISLIRDRLEKHPYIENVDVVFTERGIAEIKVFEKTIDAILLSSGSQFLISENSEILPFISSTQNIDLPVIVNGANEQIDNFSSALKNKKILCALKIISTAKLYDSNLYDHISEINLAGKDNISIHLTNIDSPVYIGMNHEIEKTVFLSKVFKQINRSELSNYIDYIDLRYNEFVYLGLDEKIINDKEKIWERI